MKKKEILEAVKAARIEMEVRFRDSHQAVKTSSIHHIGGFDVEVRMGYTHGSMYPFQAEFFYRKEGTQAWMQFGRGQANFVDVLAKHITAQTPTEVK